MRDGYEGPITCIIAGYLRIIQAYVKHDEARDIFIPEGIYKWSLIDGDFELGWNKDGQREGL